MYPPNGALLGSTVMVVASIPGDTIERAEVVTQEFSISSRTAAVLSWIAVILVPYLIASITAMVKKSEALNLLKDTIRNTKKELDEEANMNEAAIDKIAKKLEALEKEKHKVGPKRPFITPWIVSGKLGDASLSLAQILLWSMLVFSASFYVFVVSGKLLDLTDEVLVLLGIAGGASVIAKITASVKDREGQALAGAQKEPKWLDLIKTEGRPDLYKFQMALFTVLAAVFVAKKIYSTLEFPTLPAGLLTLIGISNGVYLTAKASSKTAFEELAEIDRTLQGAKTNLKKLKDKDAELGKRLETAQKAVQEAKDALGRSNIELQQVRSTDKARIDELNAKIKEQEVTIEKAEENLKEVKQEVHQKKKNMEKDLTIAEEEVKNLQNAFDKKKAQALQQ